jgi:hypothetical protein
MSERVPRGEIDLLLKEAKKYYSQAADLCKEADMGPTNGSETLEQASELTDRANKLTQRAFRLLEKERKKLRGN